MQKMLSLIALGVTLSFGAMHTADAATKTAQQQKMTTCNKEASGKKGDERKKFMSECLSAKADMAAAPASAAMSPKETQQMKMKTCNKDAAGKKGDERKKFMSECLKKDA